MRLKDKILLKRVKRKSVIDRIVVVETENLNNINGRQQGSSLSVMSFVNTIEMFINSLEECEYKEVDLSFIVGNTFASIRVFLKWNKNNSVISNFDKAYIALFVYKLLSKVTKNKYELKLLRAVFDYYISLIM